MPSRLLATLLLALVPASVHGDDAAKPGVSFRHEVLPILTKAGCNAGACHGTPTGKNGFRLSLRGYLPDLDLESLTRDSQGRRINRLDPDASLILLKATGQAPHEGGVRIPKGSAHHQMLRQWIAAGARDDQNGLRKVDSLAIDPPRRIVEHPADKLAIRVLAKFTDGTTRDVTHLARLAVTDESLARVSPDGIVERVEAGEAVVTAEYVGVMATARLAFLDSAAGFVWPNPPEHNFIDRHAFAKLRELRIAPAELCRDDEFLRRAYLDAIGKLPTPAEVRQFLANSAADKREKLVDALLERPEFADWWALKWADRLGCNQRFVGIIGALKYHAWIRDQIARNVPEDEFVRSIITAEGGNYSNPAAGFYRRLRNPQDRAEEVTQLFLGVRIGCARCHNHPGERWTQDDYHSLAAFFARIQYRDGPFFIQQYDKEETVYPVRAGEVVHPRTGTVMQPRVLEGEAPPADKFVAGDRREQLAQWLTSPTNPFFARAAVNRLWYHLLGRGIVDPVDDMRITNPPANEELLDALAADFVANGFDRKRTIALIMKSRTYQLSSDAPQKAPSPSPTDPVAEEAAVARAEKYFAKARIRLLSAEALLDAICSATGVAEKFPGLPFGRSASSLPDGEYKHPFLEAFGRPARAMACECERDTDTNLTQALHLIGGRLVQAKVRSDNGRIARLLANGVDDAALVEELFLATLSRYPSEAERKLLLGRLQAAEANRRQVAEDLLWSLVNHNEFLFQH